MKAQDPPAPAKQPEPAAAQSEPSAGQDPARARALQEELARAKAADQAGLTAQLSTALRKKDSSPAFDRGTVLVVTDRFAEQVVAMLWPALRAPGET